MFRAQKTSKNLGSKRIQTRAMAAMPQVFESHGALRQAGGAEGDGRLRPSDAPWAMMGWLKRRCFMGRGVTKCLVSCIMSLYTFLFFSRWLKPPNR